jgi:hypothetical protein
VYSWTLQEKTAKIVLGVKVKKFLGILVSDFVIVNALQAEKYLEAYMFNKKKRLNYG